jgi:hypothetical protein
MSHGIPLTQETVDARNINISHDATDCFDDSCVIGINNTITNNIIRFDYLDLLYMYGLISRFIRRRTGTNWLTIIIIDCKIYYFNFCINYNYSQPVCPYEFLQK